MSGNKSSGRKSEYQKKLEKEREGDNIINDKFDVEPPSNVIGYALQYWKMHVPILIDRGVLTSTDRESFIRLCINYKKWMETEDFIAENGQDYETKSDRGGFTRFFDYPHVTRAERLNKLIEKGEKQFGLNPLDRAQVKGNKKKKKSIRDQY
jgi:P27 family predicted phage terminase small subunit